MDKSIALLLCFVTLASAYWSPFWSNSNEQENERNRTGMVDSNMTVPKIPRQGFNATIAVPDLVSLARKLNLTRFVEHLESSKLIKVLDHERFFTVFAPSNEAFDKAPFYCNFLPEQSRMRFLVARGTYSTATLKDNLNLRTLLTRRDLRINLYDNGKIITASGMRLGRSDFKARNGILHIIDDITTCTLPKGNAVVEINSCPHLRTMAAAINKTKLYTTLNGTNPVTIFVPSDRAFASLPIAFRSRMLQSVDLLTKVVRYHVVPRAIYTEGIYTEEVIKTLDGNSLNITRTNDNDIAVDNAIVTAKDINVFNGVIHGINRVLIPENIISAYGLYNVTEY